MSDFEGLAVQILKDSGENWLNVIVANDAFIWQRTVPAVLNEWFDLLIGWNVEDGIAIKINNKRVSGTVSMFLELMNQILELLTFILVIAINFSVH